MGRNHPVAATASTWMWHINRARSDATDVELTFVDLGDGTTRLDIVHAGWERLGSEGGAWREANFSGWAVLRHSFIPAAEA